MDEKPRQKLARLMAGIPANSSPMPPAAPNPYAFLPPYAGLKNEQTLPPFEQPGSSLPPFGGPQAMTPPHQVAGPPMPQPAPAPMPAPAPQAGGQGWGGPEPAPGTMPELQQQAEIDPRYLPEQWRGRFTGWS